MTTDNQTTTSSVASQGVSRGITYRSRLTQATLSASLGLALLLGSHFDGFAQDAPNGERLYLRYQGSLDGVSGDFAEEISCSFNLRDVNGDIFWSETHDNITVIERHFSIGLGTTETLYSSLFNQPLRLLVECDIDGDSVADVTVNEPVGVTPRAAVALSTQGLVNATTVQINGTEVIDADGKWVGTPPVVNQVRIGEFDLVSVDGSWMGPVRGILIPPDQDEDGVPDLFEQLLGTNPNDPDSRPLDENEDGIFDIFEPIAEPPPTLGDRSLSDVFTTQKSAENFNQDPETIAEWVATSVDFSERGVLSSLALHFTLTHQVDTRTLEVILVTPDGSRITLVSPRVIEGATIHEEQFSFSQDTPPEGVEWRELLYHEGAPRELFGTWSLILRDNLGGGINAIAAATVFSIETNYVSETLLTFTRDLDLMGTQRVIGVPEPTLEDHVANKGYVDAQVSIARDDVSDLRGEISIDQQEVDEQIGSINDQLTQVNAQIETTQEELTSLINEAQRTPDLSYPSRFTCRTRTFETYDLDQSAYLFEDNADLFGGVTPSAWSAGATADLINDFAKLNDFLPTEIKGGANALINMTQFKVRSELEGIFSLVHFQVENTTDAPIEWPLQFQYSCHEAALNPQRSSLALNQVLAWSSEGLVCGAISQSAQVTLELPAQQVSELVMVIAASPPNEVFDPNTPDVERRRRVMLAFTGGSLVLPEGLRYRKTWE